MLVYVDDILITGDSSAEVLHLIQLLQDQFKLKTFGNVKYFLGIEVAQFDSKFVLSQKKYVLDLLKMTHMLECSPCPTPMVTMPKLSKTEREVFTDLSLYRSVVGTLQYLTLTRPDIAYSVNKLSQFLHSPTTRHWKACKRLLRYLKGTSSFGLEFSPASSLALECFSDVD